MGDTAGIGTDTSFDAIVIGSGIGGLTAGAILSRLNGKRVLILERHSVIGGLTHVFSRGRYKWDAGVHYVGRMKKGMRQRAILDFITDNQVKWTAMPDPFEHFIYPGLSFKVSSSPARYQQELINRFPHAARRIRKYFRDVKRVNNWFTRRYLSRVLPRPFAALLNLINLPGRKWAAMTTRDYFQRNFADKQLRTLLATQWCDYGTPPDESSFAMHALLVYHYIEGGFYPEGGTDRIAATVRTVLRRNAGEILAHREVREILVEGNRAVGVRVGNRRSPTAGDEYYYAPIVISNAGAKRTFDQLVPSHIKDAVHDGLRGLEPGYSAVCVYAGLNDSPRKLGVRGENLWINRREEHATMKAQTEALLSGTPAACFVSFTTLRNGAAANHTMTIISLADYEAFAQWRVRDGTKKDGAYYALKKKLADSLIDLAQKHLPGLREMIAFTEVSTPLTMKRYTNRAQGALYGLKHTPNFFRARALRAKTKLPGLYLCGADICTPGITGAMMGGVATASVISGPFGLAKVLSSCIAASRNDTAVSESSAALAGAR